MSKRKAWQQINRKEVSSFALCEPHVWKVRNAPRSTLRCFLSLRRASLPSTCRLGDSWLNRLVQAKTYRLHCSRETSLSSPSVRNVNYESSTFRATGTSTLCRLFFFYIATSTLQLEYASASASLSKKLTSNPTGTLKLTWSGVACIVCSCFTIKLSAPAAESTCASVWNTNSTFSRQLRKEKDSCQSTHTTLSEGLKTVTKKKKKKKKKTEKNSHKEGQSMIWPVDLTWGQWNTAP